MSQNLRNYVQAVHALDSVVRQVPENQWDNQSPNAEWTARQTLGHTIFGTWRITAGATGADDPAEQAETDVAGVDPAATWLQARNQLLEALDQPGALQREVEGPMGVGPLDNMLPIMAMDTLAHAWDVAASTGIAPNLPQELCEQSHAALSMMGEIVRQPGVMEAAVDVPESASWQERFVGITGRDPQFGAQ